MKLKFCMNRMNRQMTIKHVFKMNKKAGIGDNLMNNVVYLLLAVIFLVGILVFVNAQKNNGAILADYYAKEIANAVNLAQAGDEIIIDVHKPTVVAVKNKVADRNEIFRFNNNQVCVKLSPGQKSCYSYFNDVTVSDWEIKWGVPINVLKFKVTAKSKL